MTKNKKSKEPKPTGEENKGLFVVQVPQDKPSAPTVDKDGNLQEVKFDKYLTKGEFNHFLIANLDNVGGVMMGMIRQIESNRKEIADLKSLIIKSAKK